MPFRDVWCRSCAVPRCVYAPLGMPAWRGCQCPNGTEGGEPGHPEEPTVEGLSSCAMHVCVCVWNLAKCVCCLHAQKENVYKW